MSDDTHDRILSALERVEGRLSALEQKVDGLTQGPSAGSAPVAVAETALDKALAKDDVAEGLARILDRIEGLERVAAALDTLVVRAPILIDGGAEVVDWVMDEAASRGVDPFERGERGLDLLIKASSPATMDLAEKLLDDEVLAGLGKLSDQGTKVLTSPAMDALAQSGLLDPDRLEKTIAALDRLAAVAATPAFEKLLDSGLLDPQVLGTAGSATNALVAVKSGAIEPVGLFGTLGKLGDPDVQKAMGFTFALLKRFGATL